MAFSLLGVLAFACLIGTAVGLRGQLPAPPSKPHVAIPSCSRVGCVQLGDTVNYQLSGRVISVDDSQPGVRCVQVAAKTHGGNYCALTR